MEWPEVVPQAQDALPLPVDDDQSKVDWLEIEDESEQASRLVGKNPVATPTKKRGQTSLGTSASEKPKEIIDLKEVEGPASKCRRVIVDWPEDEDEEVSGIIASSQRERLARRQELMPPLQMTEPPPRPPQPQLQAIEIPRPAVAVRSDVAKPVPTTGTGAEKGVGPEKTKKSWFATIFRATDL
jgi:hypothetical protein